MNNLRLITLVTMCAMVKVDEKRFRDINLEVRSTL